MTGRRKLGSICATRGTDMMMFRIYSRALSWTTSLSTVGVFLCSGLRHKNLVLGLWLGCSRHTAPHPHPATHRRHPWCSTGLHMDRRSISSRRAQVGQVIRSVHQQACSSACPPCLH